jgi:tetratricopeptide (TPR) repeat protein
MARRVPLESLACGLALALAGPALAAGDAAPDASGTLVSYSFEDELPTGPDTIAVFEGAKGRVRLERSIRWSGFRAVEIEDVAGDGDFPELQGYFALRESGKLHAHFALLVTDPRESFNIALAGPGGFTLAEDGIAFWLLSREGFLCHFSDSMPKRLVALRPFVWYVVDASYDVDGGRYDLTIREEGVGEPVVRLTDQPNAPNRPGSAVNKFSFIGDTGDDHSNVVYYVDDVVLSAGEPVVQAPFVAPGRRKLFVDAWSDWQRLARERPRCLPVLDAEELGIGAGELELLAQDDALAALAGLLAGGAAAGPSERWSSGTRRLYDAASLHLRGCAALEQDRSDEALALFDRAAALLPGSALYELSGAMALGRLGRFDEADARMARAEPALRNTPRFAAAAATIGLARGDLDTARRWLEASGEEPTDAQLSGPLPEQYFFVLLWQGSFGEAAAYAAGMAGRLAASGRPAPSWQERTADAAFLDGDLERAATLYAGALEQAPGSALVLTKLSDVWFLLGDLDEERRLREAVFGALTEE